jgi:hypothetical protein
VIFAVAFPPRALPSAPGWVPVNLMLVESLCGRERSMVNSSTASSTSRVNNEARSASNNRASIRPTRSSLSNTTSALLARPSSVGSNGAAHSPSAYTGSRCGTRLRTTTPIAVAGASLSRASSCGRHCSSSPASPSRRQKWSMIGSAPSISVSSSNSPGLSTTASLDLPDSLT